jgi:outer membrane autotransporter protein
MVSAVGVFLANDVGSIGAMNIGAAPGDPAVAPGTLNTATVAFGAGTGTINFNHTATDYVFAPQISGNGAVNVFSGTTILTADNTYTGPTTISVGTLQLGDGGTTGSLSPSSAITDNGNFTINRSNAVSQGIDFTSSPITGTGSFTQAGTGTTTLNAANTYTGNTTINGGVLQVDGSIVSDTFVNPGGTLAGIGSIFANVINSGTVSPGDSPGTLTIGDNYTQTSAGTLKIEIAGILPGQHDLLAIGGSASLDGTLQVVRLNNFQPLGSDQVTILTTAGGRTGEFSTVLTENFGALLRPEVIYEPNDVVLEFIQLSFNIGGLTPNQVAVANNLNKAVGDLRANALIGFLDTEPLGNLPHDYDLIAPEELTSIYEIGFSQAIVQSMNLQRRMDDIRAGSTGFCAAGYAPTTVGPGYSKESDGKAVLDKNPPPAFVPAPENRWGVFVTGTGEFVNVSEEDFNAHGYDIRTGGFTLGVDYRVTPNFAIGLDGGYARSQGDLVDDGRVTVDGGKGGVYATYFNGGFYVDAAGGGGYNSYDTRRTALLGDARGSAEGREWNALVAVGYDWKFNCLKIGPTATFQYTDVRIDSFTEDGSLASLHFPDQNEDSIRSTLGFGTAYDWKTACGVIVRNEVRAAWQHEYGDRAYPIDSQFASGAGGLFTVHGPTLGRDSALVSAGVAVQWNARVSTYVYYDGVLGRDNYDSHNVSGGLRVSF